MPRRGAQATPSARPRRCALDRRRNALVDVPGVLGHRTLVDGDRLRTGVTAILPHGGNLYVEKAPGARYTINGYGKAAGCPARRAGDDREPAAAHLDALGRPGLGGRPEPRAGGQPRGRGRPRHGQRDRRRVLRRLALGCARPGRAARARARGDRSGRGRRGRRGRDRAGTGTACFGYKAGARWRLAAHRGAHVVGCLVCSNYGARRDLHMLVGPVDIDEDALSRRRPVGRS